MTSPDFELCDATYCRLEQTGEEPTDELYGTIVFAWSAGGVIGNGGFEYLFAGSFFERDPGYERTRSAYERIGAGACAASFREALGWLGDPPPSDRTERVRRFDAVPEAERERVASAFWAGQAELERQLALYIRAHTAELDARGAGENRLGDLRLRHPRKLEQVTGDTVVRSFDLLQWSAEARVERRLALVAALGAAAVAFAATAALRGQWPWLVPAGAAVILVLRLLRPRLWLILRRDAEQVRLGGWEAADERVFSFVAEVVKRSWQYHDPDDEDDDGDSSMDA